MRITDRVADLLKEINEIRLERQSTRIVIPRRRPVVCIVGAVLKVAGGVIDPRQSKIIKPITYAMRYVRISRKRGRRSVRIAQVHFIDIDDIEIVGIVRDGLAFKELCLNLNIAYLRDSDRAVTIE